MGYYSTLLSDAKPQPRQRFRDRFHCSNTVWEQLPDYRPGEVDSSGSMPGQSAKVVRDGVKEQGLLSAEWPRP